MFKISKCTPEQISDTTEFRHAMYQDQLAQIKRLTEDPQKEARQAALRCVMCWYQGGIAGQAFTNYTCVGCGARSQHHNTNTPVLCPSCAGNKALCQNCGAQREYHLIEPKPRKKRGNYGPKDPRDV